MEPVGAGIATRGGPRFHLNCADTVHYQHAFANDGSMLLTVDAGSLSSEDIDDLSVLFKIVEKTLRRIVAKRQDESAPEGGKVAAAPCGDAGSKEMEEQTDLHGAPLSVLPAAVWSHGALAGN